MLVPHSDVVDGPAQPMEGERLFSRLIQFDLLMELNGRDEIEWFEVFLGFCDFFSYSFDAFCSF